MKIYTKRIYELPSADDNYRVLVDRLWPRGVSKEKAQLDLWAKDITPSNELRKWFHAHDAQFAEFEQAYLKELHDNSQTEDFLAQIKTQKIITLLTAAKDINHCHVPTLQRFIENSL